MTNKYHISQKGNPESCYAKTRGCPLGGEDEHYTSPEAARAAFEKSQGQTTVNGLKKNSAKAANLAEPNDLEKLQESMTYIDDEGNEKTMDNYLYNKSEKTMLMRLASGKSVQDKHLDQFIENNSSFDNYLDHKFPHLVAHAKVNKTVKEIREKRGTPNTLPTVDSFDPSVNTVFSSSRAQEKPSIMEYQMDAEQNSIGLQMFSLLKAEKEGKDTNSIKQNLFRSQALLEAMNKEYLYNFKKAEEAYPDPSGPKRSIGGGDGSFTYERPKSYPAWSEVYPEVKNAPIKLKPLK